MISSYFSRLNLAPLEPGVSSSAARAPAHPPLSTCCLLHTPACCAQTDSLPASTCTCHFLGAAYEIFLTHISERRHRLSISTRKPEAQGRSWVTWLGRTELRQLCPCFRGSQAVSGGAHLSFQGRLSQPGHLPNPTRVSACLLATGC